MGGAALTAAKGVDGVDPCLLSPAEAELLERDHLAARLVEARLFNDAQKGTVTEIQAAAAAREVLQLHSLERAAGGETAGTSGVVRQRVAFDVEAGGFVRRPAEADAMASAEAAEDEASRDRRRGVGVRPGGTEVPTNSVDAWEGQERAEHCDDEPDKGAMDLKLLEQVGGDVLFAHPPRLPCRASSRLLLRLSRTLPPVWTPSALHALRSTHLIPLEMGEVPCVVPAATKSFITRHNILSTTLIL